MPGSIRAVDATSTRYDADPIEDYPCAPQTVVVNPASFAHTSTAGLPPSPAQSDMNMTVSEESPSATTREERRITRVIDRGCPGDQAIFSENKTPEQKELAKRKSQFYGDVFAHRESVNSARERVSRESPILADVRTNVIVSDEYTFITDLSYALSTRYQRPEGSIIVSLTHSCCLLFGGNFDPAYTLTINALPSQLQPVTNKRNATLLAKAMEEGLGVHADRGLIKFCAIGEENMATDGKTMAQGIEDLEKKTSETNVNLQQNLAKNSADHKRRQSMKSLRSLRAKSLLATHDETLPSGNDNGDPTTPPMPTMPAIPSEMSSLDKRAEATQKMGRRKSFIATIFGRT